MASQNDPEPSTFDLEIHTNHNALPPSDEEEHGKPRIAPDICDILQFIVDQNEVDNLWRHYYFEVRRAIVQPNPVDDTLPLTDYFISYYVDIFSPNPTTSSNSSQQTKPLKTITRRGNVGTPGLKLIRSAKSKGTLDEDEYEKLVNALEHIDTSVCTNKITNNAGLHTTLTSCRDSSQDTHRQILTPVSLIIMDAVSRSTSGPRSTALIVTHGYTFSKGVPFSSEDALKSGVINWFKAIGENVTEDDDSAAPEKLKGRIVLMVEYYPTDMTETGGADHEPASVEEQELEEEWEKVDENGVAPNYKPAHISEELAALGYYARSMKPRKGWHTRGTNTSI